MTLFFAAVIGLVLGSFISMLSWRLPLVAEQSAPEQWKTISFGGSKCPHCQSALPWYRLIPVFSWLASRGRCHACKAKISPRYPLIELSSALITLFTVFYFGLNLNTLFMLFFMLTLLTISIIDLEHHLILDSLSLPLMWVGLVFNAIFMFVSPEQAILGAVAGYGILWIIFHGYRLLTGKEGMGYGDFKLLAALGAWLGIEALVQIILIAALSSLVVALILMVTGRHQWQQHMAFGPFLALGGIISLFLGGNWLLSQI